MFCRHDWTIIDKTVLDSAYEQMVKSGLKRFKCEHMSGIDIFEKTVLYVFKCRKCFKVKRESERS